MSPATGPIHLNPRLIPPLRAVDGSLWRVLELKGIEWDADGEIAKYTCTLAPVPEPGPTPPHDVDLPAFDSAFRRARIQPQPEEPPDRSWIRMYEPFGLRTWFGRPGKVTDDRGVEHCPTCDAAEGPRGTRHASIHCVDQWHRRTGWKWRWGRGGPPRYRGPGTYYAGEPNATVHDGPFEPPPLFGGP